MNILAFAGRAGSGPLLSGSTLRSLLVVILHAAAIAWALHAPGATLNTTAPVPVPMALVAVMLAPPARPVAPAPLPLPSRPQAVAAAAGNTRPAARPVPQPTPAAAALTASSAASTAAEAAPIASAAPALAPAVLPQVAATPVVAARFDADYLNNPAPAYPLLSRRNGEAGKVLLLVQVTAQGTAAQVELKQGSGFPRLDEAALNAVRKWRFVPARRGDEAVAASVLVPLTFRLDS